MIKEKEIDALAMPWVNTQVAYLLAVQWATARLEGGKVFAGESDPNEYDEIITTKITETIDAFSSYVIHAKKRTAHTGEGINVMTPALFPEDGSLPQGLMVQNIYTEPYSSSENVTVLVRNSTMYPQTLRKKTPVARAVIVTWVPELSVHTNLMDVSEEAHCPQAPKLAMNQRQEKLLRS